MVEVKKPKDSTKDSIIKDVKDPNLVTPKSIRLARKKNPYKFLDISPYLFRRKNRCFDSEDLEDGDFDD